MKSPNEQDDHRHKAGISWLAHELAKDMQDALGTTQDAQEASPQRLREILEAVTPSSLSDVANEFLERGSSNERGWSAIVDYCARPDLASQDIDLLRDCLAAIDYGNDDASIGRIFDLFEQHGITLSNSPPSETSQLFSADDSAAAESPLVKPTRLAAWRDQVRTAYLDFATAARKESPWVRYPVKASLAFLSIAKRMLAYLSVNPRTPRWKIVVTFASLLLIAKYGYLRNLAYQHSESDKAALMMSRGLYREAISHIDTLEASIGFKLAGWDFSSRHATLRAAALINIGQYDDALSIIDELLTETEIGRSNRATLHTYKVAALTGKRDFQGVAHLYSKPRTRDKLLWAPLPQYATALTNIGLGAASVEDYKAAAQAFHAVTEIYSASDTMSLQALSVSGHAAWIAVQRGNDLVYEQAIWKCRNYFRILPESHEKNVRFARALNNVGYGKLQRGLYADAAELFSEGRELNLGEGPSSVWLRECLANNLQAAEDERKDGTLFLVAVMPQSY